MASSHPLFTLIRDEIPGYAGAAFGTFEAGGLETDGKELEDVSADLQGIARSWHQTWKDLGGAVDFGSNDELLVSASKAYLLFKLNHEKGRFVVVRLRADGNIGYLRFRMRDYLRRAGA